jgi:hypothetical protein
MDAPNTQSTTLVRSGNTQPGFIQNFRYQNTNPYANTDRLATLEARITQLERAMTANAHHKTQQNREMHRELFSIRQATDNGIGNLQSVIQTSIHSNKIVLDQLRHHAEGTGKNLDDIHKKQAEVSKAVEKQQMMSIMLLKPLGLVKVQGEEEADCSSGSE